MFYKKGSNYTQVSCNHVASVSIGDIGFNKRAGFTKMSSVDVPNFGVVDLTFLEAASQHHQISDDPYDYKYSINRIVVGSIPNRNMDCFPTNELAKWNGLQGKEGYRTFEGKPLYFEHNQVPLDARGIIISSRFKKEGGYYIVENFFGADTRKDHTLANQIYNAQRPHFSMGCVAPHVSCSICGPEKKFATERDYCHHFKSNLKGHIVGGKLCYEVVHDMVFIEQSSVADPAALIAGKSDRTMINGITF